MRLCVSRWHLGWDRRALEGLSQPYHALQRRVADHQGRPKTVRKLRSNLRRRSRWTESRPRFDQDLCQRSAAKTPRLSSKCAEPYTRPASDSGCIARTCLAVQISCFGASRRRCSFTAVFGTATIAHEAGDRRATSSSGRRSSTAIKPETLWLASSYRPRVGVSRRSGSARSRPASMSY